MSSYLAPPVSVVIPVRNEERYLEESVAGVLNQGYPGPMEIILAIASSTDRTAEIAQDLAVRDDRIRVIDNPDGTTPKPLNLGVAVSQYDIIVRGDAHGELGPEYIATAVELLERTGAANVGGIMDAKGRTPFEQAVAVAYTSKLGLGNSAFHQG
ncbi:glycosyltransferase, partial [Escherichia coli]|uniref:glycosyltransferase n=1 Tax=Escherichia coli TaxID=562 RepID=UPI001115AA06